MIQPILNHLTQALSRAGLKDDYVRRETRVGDQYPTAPIAFIYPTNGSVHVGLQRVRAEPGIATYSQYSGTLRVVCELIMSSQIELDRAVDALLIAVAAPFQETENRIKKFLQSNVTLSWIDDEGGRLPGLYSIRLEFTAPLESFTHSAKQRINSIELMREIEGGNPNE